MKPTIRRWEGRCSNELRKFSRDCNIYTVGIRSLRKMDSRTNGSDFRVPSGVTSRVSASTVRTSLYKIISSAKQDYMFELVLLRVHFFHVPNIGLGLSNIIPAKRNA
jgi:hypothetical protein